ncbi:hypothetical protein AVEN_148053-1 [Araneus ventricosus]|uniref:Uncharacterized protein n=1 Tax=Araneus ventricosus TaxID=182803 RepID=A0A4Y2T5G5_ARAVE|nr:hypothetical protein AVEN_148053-1 [Araneus ventricosus]
METGYRKRNSFRVGRRSFEFAILAHLSPKGNECATAAKPKRRMINYKSGAKNKSKPQLPSDASYSKWIVPSTTGCYSDRRQQDNLTNRVLVGSRQNCNLQKI